MIIECRQLACATMLIEPRRLASASTVSQIPPGHLELADPDQHQQHVHRAHGIGRDASRVGRGDGAAVRGRRGQQRVVDRPGG
jgi:hypothetical protein